MPKNYDREKQGHCSAGLMHPPPKKPAKVKGTPNTGAIYGNEADVENQLPK